ncbi:MAG: cupin domain-containing protein [Candidatus Saccharimonadales bacterium]
MKKWSDEDGAEFRNSNICYGREYNPGSGTIDIAKISVRGEFPGRDKYGYLEEAHEMAVVVRGEGYIETKKGEHHDLKVGDVVYVKPMERFRWGGNMDLVVSCGPAFDPGKHKIEEA